MYKQRLSASGQTIKEAEKHDIHQTKTKVAANDTAAANATTAGTPGCGSCYGAEDKEGDCCNTCEEVRRAGAGALCVCGCWQAGMLILPGAQHSVAQPGGTLRCWPGLPVALLVHAALQL